MQNHHVIPISLMGENKKENIITLTNPEHQILHNEQDIHKNHIRRYKERTNHILVPNEYVMDARLDLWKRFFANIGNLDHHLQIFQLRSLNAQQNVVDYFNPNKNAKEYAYEMCENIILMQWAEIQKILNQK